MSPLFLQDEGLATSAATRKPLFEAEPGAELPRLNTAAAQGGNPAQAARVLKLQQKTGLPPDLIKGDLDAIEAEAGRRDFDPEDFMRRSPKVAAWLAENPEHYALARNDLDQMSTWEALTTALGGGFATGRAQTRLGRLGFRAASGGLQEGDSGRIQALEREIEAAPGGQGFIGQWVAPAAKIAGQWVESGEAALPAALAGGSGGALAGALGGPASPITAPAGAAAGFTAGLTAGFLADVFQTEAGLAYLEMGKVKGRADQPLDETAKRGAAVLVGLANAGLEVAGLKLVTAPYKAAARQFIAEGVKDALVRPGAAAALSRFAGSYLAGVGGEVATEVLQETMNVLGEEVAKLASQGDFASVMRDPEERAAAWERLAGIADETFRGMALLGGVGPGARLTADTVQARRAKQRELAYRALGEGIANSETHQALPEKTRELIGRLTADGPIETLFVDAEQWQTYFQGRGIDPRQAAREVWGDPSHYDEALASGHALAIPTADYAAKLAPTEHNEFFARELRRAPDEMNAREADDLAATFEAEAQAAQEEEAAQAQPQEAGETLRNLIGSQLEAAGFDPSSAGASAQQMAAAFTTLAERAGVDPQALFARYGVQVRRRMPDVLAKLPSFDQLDVMLDKLRAGALDLRPNAQSLLDFIRDKGGVRDDQGDVASMEPNEGTRRPGRFNILREEGRALDDMAQLAAEAGYIEAHDKNALLEAMDRELGGNPVYSVMDSGEVMTDERAGLEELAGTLRQFGIDPETMENEAIKARLQEALGAEVAVSRQEPSAPETLFQRARKLFQSAFHGSPFSFDRFDLSKIGTGEGAQAYGWGLYFAGRKEVAQYYRDALAPVRATIQINRIQKTRTSAPLQDLAPGTIQILQESNFDLESTIGRLSLYEDARSQRDAETLRTWQKRDFKLEQRGRIFEVDIPEDDTFLVWDKSLGEHPQQIQDAVLKALTPSQEAVDYWRERLQQDFEENGPSGYAQARFDRVMDEAFAFGGYGEEFGQSVWDELNEAAPEIAEEARQFIGRHSTGLDPVNDTGEQIYRLLSSIKKNEQEASLILSALGVSGIRYLDQASRGKGEGSYNYVVFDDKLINIIRMEQAARQGDDPRGAINIGVPNPFDPKNRLVIIELSERADLSTFLHESAHLYAFVLQGLSEELAARPEAELSPTQRQILADENTLLAWLGAARWEDVTVEGHEKFARGFEAYLMEGKAPSAELRAAFARFRAWLVAIYRAIRALDVKLNPEVRAAFDRMVATDRQIEAAEAEAEVTAVFATPEEAGMTPEAFAAYRTGVEEAGLKARERLQNRLMAQYRREREAWWKERREEVRAEVQFEVDADPAQQALAALRTGARPDGSPLTGPDGNPMPQVKLDRDALARMYGPKSPVLKRLRRLLVYRRTGEGRVHPDAAAEMFGYRSGDELVQALLNARPRKVLIEAETDVRMRERHGDLLTDGSIAEAAREAIHGPEREKVVREELRALRALAEPQRLLDRQEKAAARAARALIPGQDTVDRLARERLARTRVRDIRPDTYLAAARKASREAFKAATAKDYALAAEAKQREMLNVALYREAVRVREEVDGVVERMRGFRKLSVRQRLGKAGGEYLEQIDALLERFDFAPVTLKEIARRQGLMQWAESQKAEGLPVEVPEEVLNEAFRKPWREMTWEELQGVSDAVKHIDHLSKLKNRLLKSQAKRELDEAAGEVRASIYANARTARARTIETRLPQDASARAVAGWFGGHRKLSSLARQMDGFEEGGAAWELLVRPLNEAGDREASMNAEAAEKLRALFASAYGAAELQALHRREHIPAIGDSLSKMGRLMVALNWGNEGNRAKLMSGYGWAPSQVQNVLSTLDERDWNFVQGVWDFIDSYWPEIAAKQERVTGIAPEKVEATPVETPFGTLRGGYFPLKYDDRQSARASGFRTQEMAEQIMQGAHARATTRRGHTKERVSGVNLPVRLDLGVIFEHVGQVVHDLSHHEALMDVSRVLGHRQVQEAIYETFGDETYRLMRETLLDIAAGDLSAEGTVGKAARWLRQGSSVAMMGWSLTTAMLQPLGLSISMSRIGVPWVARGLSRWLRGAEGMESGAAWIREKSPFMANRFRTMNREINEIRNRIAPDSWLAARADVAAERLGVPGRPSAVGESFFWLIGRMQLVADIPTWLGMYEKMLAEGKSEADAVALADQAVLDSQGGGQIKDLAQAQRGGELQRLFTNFYSYFNVVYNNLAEANARLDAKDPASAGRFASDVLLLLVVPAVLESLMRAAMKPGDEPLPVEMARNLAGQGLSLMVGVREAAGFASGFLDYQGPAGLRFFAELGKLVRQVGQGEVDAALLKSLNNAAGILFHFPAAQVSRTVDGFAALVEGRTANPLALVAGGPRK